MKKETLSSGIFTNGEENSRMTSQANNTGMEASAPLQNKVTEIQESITVYSPVKPSECSPSDDMMLVDNSIQLSTNQQTGIRATESIASSHSDAVILSFEDTLENELESLERQEHQAAQEEVPKPQDAFTAALQTAISTSGAMEAAVSSPLTDLAWSISPDARQNGVHATASASASASASAVSPLSGPGFYGRTASDASRPMSKKASTPKSAGFNRVRRESNDSINLEHLPEATEKGTPDEEASLKLALQLQQEEYSLRRRSK